MRYLPIQLLLIWDKKKQFSIKWDKMMGKSVEKTKLNHWKITILNLFYIITNKLVVGMGLKKQYKSETTTKKS